MTEVDYQLRAEMAEVGRQVVRLTEHIGQVSGQISAVDAAQQQTHREVRQLKEHFLEFMRKTERDRNVQRAETRRGRIQDEIEHEFGHYKVVRRTATGILQAFDLGLVSEGTVQNISEELMLQTPRYWLAPALVALASWAADDRSLCERAVEEAYRRSPERTSLLFSLVLRRQNRRPAAVRWLRHYLHAQDPTALGREFAVILECVSQGAFGPEGRQLVKDALRRWSEPLMRDEAVRKAQVGRWRAEIENLRGPASAGDFPRLAKVSGEWPALDAALSSARAQQAVLDKYTAMSEREYAVADRLEDAIDDILDQLVGEYDNEELPRRRELAHEKAVIEQEGDLTAARSQTDAEAASLAEELDCLTVQTAAALDPEAIGVSPATQRTAVVACREWFEEAHGGFTRDYRAALPQTVSAVFSATHTIGRRTFRLPEWHGRLSGPLPAQEQGLSRHWNTRIRPFVDSLGYRVERRLIAPTVVCALILLFGAMVNIWAALLVALVVGGIWAAVIASGYRNAKQAQEAARQALGRARDQSLQELRGAAAELTDWQSAFAAADAVEPRTRQLITSLSTAAADISPFEGRTVRPSPADS